MGINGGIKMGNFFYGIYNTSRQKLRANSFWKYSISLLPKRLVAKPAKYYKLITVSHSYKKAKLLRFLMMCVRNILLISKI
jgi:hypothetical protein